MKKKKILIELAYFIFILFFFYEGISKMIAWSNFSIWLHRAPIIGPLYVPLTYGIPLTEVALSIGMIMPTTRTKALILAIAAFFCYILWVIVVHAFIHTLFFYPYFDFWKGPTWMEKVLVSLLLMVVGGYTLLLSPGDALVYETSDKMVASS